MAFWGVEVKPGKPFTHKYDDCKGRLHVSMATLGLGLSSGATAKSTLQCNVGNRSPVYVCSLYPGTTESLQLNIELEEDDQVVFSVIGPTSIHLCGYYLSIPHNTNAIRDDSESYGEDIGDTETERSDYSDNEDDYDDSFIDDDGDPEVFPPSPISEQEEASLDNIPKGSSLRRLRKKYQTVESDDDGCDEEKIIVDDIMDDQTEEIKNEDSLPISSLYKKKASVRVLDQEMDASVDRGADDASNNNGADGGNCTVESNLKADLVLFDSQTHREAELSNHLEDPCTVVDAKNFKKKNKRKDKEPKMTQDFVEGNNQQQHAEDKETETMDEILPSSEVYHGQGEKPKKKRKERSKEEVLSVATDASHNNVVNLPQSNEHKKQHTVNEIGDNSAHDFPDGIQSVDRNVRKKRKSKSQGNGEVADFDIRVSGETEMTEDRNKREDTKPSQVRTLSNGLVVQELEKGKKDGKIAAPGKKISIYYTGKLKENGEVFESNTGQAPYKFRLGKGDVMKGWNAGFEGMQVGEKRRLVIPPSLMPKSDGHSAEISPDSWLVYDVELVKVH